MKQSSGPIQSRREVKEWASLIWEINHVSQFTLSQINCSKINGCCNNPQDGRGCTIIPRKVQLVISLLCQCLIICWTRATTSEAMRIPALLRGNNKWRLCHFLCFLIWSIIALTKKTSGVRPETGASFVWTNPMVGDYCMSSHSRVTKRLQFLQNFFPWQNEQNQSGSAPSRSPPPPPQ